jgi:Ca2+ transporting ATPase
MYTETGIKEITPEILKSINIAIGSFADKTLRTLLLVYKDLQSMDEFPKDESDRTLEKIGGFTMFALVGIRDTIKDEVPNAIQLCKTAKIRVRMVTGDNKRTAEAIAKQIKILEPSDIKDDQRIYSCEGTDFDGMVRTIKCKVCKKSISKFNYDLKKKELIKQGVMTDVDKQIDIGCACPIPDIKNRENGTDIEEFKNKFKDTLCVMSRSFPEHKHLLVSMLMECGSVVAVTGDGTNDAPALKKANVGFAMGIAGTEVAKDAAAIILLDDNFASIVVAAKWGRSIYENIRKFIQFQLSVNIVALVLNLLSSAVLQESPLTPIQLLWINLIMDSFASLALATQPPDDELLKRPPYQKNEYIISRKMMKHILGQSIYQVIVLCIILFAGEYFIPEENKSQEVSYIDDTTKVASLHTIYWRRPGTELVRTGRRYDYSGKEYSSEAFKGHAIDEPLLYTRDIFFKVGASRHYTVVFCVFIFMQIFNELNARKINDELNIFQGMGKNPIYLIIWFGTIVITALLIQFAGRVFNCSNGGLKYHQWLICIGFSMVPLVVRLLLKAIPDKACPQIGQKESDPTESKGATILKGSSRVNKSLTYSMNKKGSAKAKH